MTNTYTGTAKELEQKQTKINGTLVEPLHISTLAKFGLAKVVGSQKPANGKGKSANIYELTSSVDFEVTQ